VEQKGSYVSDKALRFDFSHFQKMTEEEIRKVEEYVTREIRNDHKLVEQRHVPIEEAIANGAMALFGEKYGDDVRTVRFGNSIELCGGTHISSTGRIGTFRIVNESAIAAGIRRIEAVTAKGCEDYLYRIDDLMHEIKSSLNSPDLILGLKKLIEENDGMKKELHEFIKEKTETLKKTIIEMKREVNGVSVFTLVSSMISPEIVKDIAFQLKGEFTENMLFVAGTSLRDKPTLTVMLSSDLVERGMNAGNMVREAAKFIQGGGGGQPHFATAGGKNSDGLNQAIDSILGKI
jgi:alanyl-tRNA synthetase